MGSQTADFKRAENEALKILMDCGIEKPPVNPVQIAENLNISVSFVTFSGEAEGVSGFYDFEASQICVNAMEPPLRQTFTIAHELGHTVLHRMWAESSDYKVLLRDSELQIKDVKEQEANAFAANLLMPRFMMKHYYELPVSDLSSLFAVSIPAIKARLAFLYGI